MSSPKPKQEKAGGRGSTRRARQEHRRKVRRWTRIGLAGVVVVGAATVGAVILKSGSDNEPAGADGTELDLQLGDYFIAGDLEILAGPVRIKATNVGRLIHNVGVRRGPITKNLFTGETAEIDLGELIPGTYELYCDVDDHVAQGMVATLHVTEAAPGTAR